MADENSSGLEGNAEKNITHKEALEITKKQLQELLKDPLLADIPKDNISSSEVQARIDLEKGKAFVVYLKRESSVCVLETLLTFWSEGPRSAYVRVCPIAPFSACHML